MKYDSTTLKLFVLVESAVANLEILEIYAKQAYYGCAIQKKV